jgi:hypothetical protein
MQLSKWKTIALKGLPALRIRHNLRVPLFEPNRYVHNAKGVKKPKAKQQHHDYIQHRFDGPGHRYVGVDEVEHQANYDQNYDDCDDRHLHLFTPF